MRKQTSAWLRLLLGGALLFGSSTCISDQLRDVSNDLDGLANDLSGNDENDDVSQFFYDLGDLFGN